MLNSDFFGLSLSIQVALGAGYLGYVTAYAGYREAHAAEDKILISLVFASIAMLVFGPIEAEFGPFRAAVACLVVSQVVAGFWRSFGRRWWLAIVSTARVHRDDGVHHGWSKIVQTTRNVGQISVHLTDGRILYLNDRRKYKGSEGDGLYLGGDGSIAMVVEEEELPDGRTEVREDVACPIWGTRLTFIPASQVARVNIRLK